MTDRPGYGEWTKKELKILTQFYPTEGAIAVMRRLHKAGFPRGKRSVQSKAHKLMLTVGDVTGYVSVAELMGNSSNANYYRALFYACRDGVLKTLVSKRTRYLVPEEWADAYAERRADPSGTRWEGKP